MDAGPATPQRPLVAMCAGKDCRARKEFPAVRKELAACGDLLQVDCLGLCAGPVVVVAPAADQPVVISKVRSKQQRRDLVRLVADDGRLTKSLRNRRVDGSKRAKTVKRLRKSLPTSA